MLNIEIIRVRKFIHELKRKAERKLMRKLGVSSPEWKARKASLQEKNKKH